MKLNIRENWRIWLLVVFVVVSTVAIFAPLGAGGPGGDTNATNATNGSAAPQSTASEYTNLRFGLELAGGTQVRAPLVGMTAEGLTFDADQAGQIEETLQAELDIGPGDVRADPRDGTVEVFVDADNGNVTQAEFAAALQAADLSASQDDVRKGVTAETREDAVDVLSSKIDRSGLSGGTVTQATSPGETFILVEVPGADREDVLDLIGEQGLVQTVALYPVETGNETEYRTANLTTQEDFANVGQATIPEGNDPPFVPVTLTDEAAPGFQSAMQEYGFDRQGGTRCNYDLNQSLEENRQSSPGRCLLTVRDGEVVYAASVGNDLASSFRSGQFVQDPGYITQTTNFEEARELEINLKVGALPTQLDLEEGTTFFLLPSLAQQFKPLSLLTGAAAVVAVSLMVFFRYRRADVAAPMVLTAAAEVYVLLGFAAAVGLPLELSHIAGFIAVIGTGVDDLVIIADEIMQRGNIETSKVFESRFRKAFWVIGAAAATTIIAMSPLAVLSLGDLRGFAIVTIVGVLVGVLITRPAYGDILRVLVLRRRD
ncbi:preprotein translocase subunit SecD [Natronomonas marina]|jgi:preprotein translocase subunit SecD|uniref:preprotein translocase subunit SecD n=1 Tax=Natronomonas marina TaxID=2961939 RepID=UPI0020C97810|nr:preprotein translocase subunit SecD [Natronomonas marina]